MAKQLITSAQWWATTKSDNTRLHRWLQNQYHGETMAAERLQLVIEQFGHEMTQEQRKTVSIIADQEKNHAMWVRELLMARNIAPTLLDKKERYWDHTLVGIDSFIKASAVAAHAEEMRLERIRTIATDEEAPEDIRSVFGKILPQEEFHARAFKKMTTTDVYDATQDAHELGRVALGLVP